MSRMRPRLRPVALGTLVALAALLGAGCGDDDDEASADPCAARLDAMEARLEAAAAGAEPAGAPSAVSLPSASRGAPLGGPRPLLVVSRDEVRLAGRGVGGGDDLERLAETLGSDLRGLARSRGGDSPPTVALWVAAELPVHRLARLLSRAPPDQDFVLLARGPRPERADAPPWVAEGLEPPPLEPDPVDAEDGRFWRARRPDDPRARRERVEALWERATTGCEAARGHLPAPPERTAAGPPLGPPSVDPLMRVLRRCGCDEVDLAAVEAVAHAALVSPEGPLVRVGPKLRFGLATGEGREIRAGDATVAALVSRLAGVAADRAWIRAE